MWRSFREPSGTEQSLAANRTGCDDGQRSSRRDSELYTASPPSVCGGRSTVKGRLGVVWLVVLAWLLPVVLCSSTAAVTAAAQPSDDNCWTTTTFLRRPLAWALLFQQPARQPVDNNRHHLRRRLQPSKPGSEEGPSDPPHELDVTPAPAFHFFEEDDDDDGKNLPRRGEGTSAPMATAAPTTSPSLPTETAAPTSRATTSVVVDPALDNPDDNPASVAAETPSSDDGMDTDKRVDPATAATTAVVVPLQWRTSLLVTDPAVVGTDASSRSSSINWLAARVASLWEVDLEDKLIQARLIESSYITEVDLTVLPTLVEEPEADAANTNTRHRTLQQQSTEEDDVAAAVVVLDTTGMLVMQPVSVADAKSVETELERRFVSTEPEGWLSQQSLQNTLEEGGLDDVTVSDVVVVQAEEEQNNDNEDDGPSTVELAFGIIIAVVALASLVFWAVVLWRKRDRRLKKQRASMAATGSSTGAIGSSRSSTGGPTRFGRNTAADTITKNRASSAFAPSSRVRTASSSDDDDESSSYKGLGDSSDDDDEVSDFGEELKLAASLDRAAWDDFERKRRELAMQGRMYSSSPSTAMSPTTTRATSAAPTSNSGNMGQPAVVAGGIYYDAMGSQEQGVEIDAAAAGILPPLASPTSSFPYGDENVDTNTHMDVVGADAERQELTAQDAVPWTAAGIVLGALGNRRGRPNSNEEEKKESFEPYGDKKKSERPSHYSFMYPFKGQTPSLLDQSLDTTTTTEDPTTKAVRNSPTMSSWSSPANNNNNNYAGVARAQASSPTFTRETEETEEVVDEDDRAAQVMLQEVQQLSDFVKRYEQKKLSRRLDTSTSEPLESYNNSSVQYDALSDSVSGSGLGVASPVLGKAASKERRVQDTEPALYGIAPSSSASSFGGDGSESDDGSQRLGISRYSVQKPPAPLLSYKAERPPGLDSEEEEEAVGPDDENDLGVMRRKQEASDWAMPDGSGHTPSIAPSDELGGSSGRSRLGDRLKLRRKRSPVAPRVRSSNEEFDNIVTMFESKPKKPITPPSESWQFNY